MHSSMKMDFICKEPQPPETDDGGISDNENSEDEQLEHAAWQDVDLNPAVELVAKLVRESLDAGKTYNKSITAKTSQLLTSCDNLVLEIKSLAEARAESRQRSGQRLGQGGGCTCAQAMAMLPLRNPHESLAAAVENVDASATKQTVDDTTEDQTDSVLAKMEAAIVRLREMVELIQATSMQGEANLVSKVSLQTGTFQALEAAVQASAAAATATAIAQERGRSSSAFSRLCMPLQVQKLQEWYYSYPRPLLDELTLMRTILNYRPYANPFQVGGLTLAHVRDWFKRRRFRERMRYVKLAVEAGHDAQAAEEEIDLRLEQRITHLRASVDPNDLVKEVDRVRAQSYLYDAAVNAFTRPNNIRSYIAASHSIPTTAEQHGSNANGRGKRQRTQDSDLDDITMVKHATVLEVMALQNRLRSLMEQSKTKVVTNGLQQVVDLLRSMKVDPDVRIQSGLVADLKHILKEYTKPTLLRKATIALLESLGMNRRAVVEQDVDDDAPLSAPASPALSTASSTREQTKLKFGHSPMDGLKSSSAVFGDDSSLLLSEEPPTKKAKSSAEPREKEKKVRVLRPMKFSMDQLTALEAWFQQKYKPSQEEMEDYLVQLNTPPLRDLKKQRVDVNMTQLRRWFNKRRCLRRPPFALMTQQEAAKEGSKNPAILKAVSSPNNGVEPVESTTVDEGMVDASPEIEPRAYDDTNDDSSDDNNDDDDDDDDGDDDDDDDDDDGSSDDGEHLIDQALA